MEFTEKTSKRKLLNYRSLHNVSVVMRSQLRERSYVMTRNQLTYWQNQETVRNNRAVEKETNRHNVATERTANFNAYETMRHNRAGEAETSRSNKANEQIRRDSNAISLSKLQEDSRHNRAQESVNLLDATTRQHAQRETARHNVEQEKAATYSNVTNRLSANQNAMLGFSRLAEEKRSNKANEAMKGISLGVNTASQLLSDYGLLRRLQKYY